MSWYDHTGRSAVEGGPVDGVLLTVRKAHEDGFAPVLADVEKKQLAVNTLEPTCDDVTGTGVETEPLCLAKAELPLLASKFEALASREAVCGREMEQTKTRHNQVRGPIEVRPLESALVLGILLLLETMVNAGFFLNAGMTASPLSALLTSGLISVTNIAVCTAAGFFLGRRLDYGARALDSADPQFRLQRIGGWMGTVLVIVVMGYFHATVGLIRALESLDLVQHDLDAYRLVLATPDALFLILVGSVLSVVAWHKGRRSFSDPYLHYTEMQRQLERPRAEAENLYRQQAERIEDDAQDELDALAMELEDRRKQEAPLIKARAELEEAEARLARKVRSAESELRSDIILFLGLHRAGRDTSAQPVPSGSALLAALPDELTSFAAYLPTSSAGPTPTTAVDQSARVRLIAEAKTEAIAALEQAWRDAFGPALPKLVTGET